MPLMPATLRAGPPTVAGPTPRCVIPVPVSVALCAGSRVTNGVTTGGAAATLVFARGTKPLAAVAVGTRAMTAVPFVLIGPTFAVRGRKRKSAVPVRIAGARSNIMNFEVGERRHHENAGLLVGLKARAGEEFIR